jgi:hypothetical protein
VDDWRSESPQSLLTSHQNENIELIKTASNLNPNTCSINSHILSLVTIDHQGFGRTIT